MQNGRGQSICTVRLAGMFMPGLLQDQEKETRADDDNTSSESQDSVLHKASRQIKIFTTQGFHIQANTGVPLHSMVG